MPSVVGMVTVTEVGVRFGVVADLVLVGRTMVVVRQGDSSHRARTAMAFGSPDSCQLVAGRTPRLISMSTPVLTLRDLNRATLARQLLLERHSIPPLDAIEHLAGLQAQSPMDPYLGLWARIEGFDPEALSTAIQERRVVRAQLMRATIHMVTAADHPYFAGVTADVLRRVFRTTPFARETAEVDFADLLERGRRLLEDRPLSRAELGRALREIWPQIEPVSLAQAVTYHLPLVQVPPRGLWRRSGSARWAHAEDWLGVPPEREPTPDRLMLRYLAAFGPASVADARTWSNLTGLAEVFDRLRPQLIVFRDEDGRELFDLEDAPRPPADTPAPCRFLPEFDNVLLSHADRRRVAPGRTPDPWTGSVLVDGVVAGQWRYRNDRGDAHLAVRLFDRPVRSTRDEIEGEAGRLARFLAPEGVDPDLRIEDP